VVESVVADNVESDPSSIAAHADPRPDRSRSIGPSRSPANRTCGFAAPAGAAYHAPVQAADRASCIAVDALPRAAPLNRVCRWTSHGADFRHLRKPATVFYCAASNLVCVGAIV
jgi:hypothetical protein